MHRKTMIKNEWKNIKEIRQYLLDGHDENLPQNDTDIISLYLKKMNKRTI